MFKKLLVGSEWADSRCSVVRQLKADGFQFMHKSARFMHKLDGFMRKFISIQGRRGGRRY